MPAAWRGGSRRSAAMACWGTVSTHRTHRRRHPLSLRPLLPSVQRLEAGDHVESLRAWSFAKKALWSWESGRHSSSAVLQPLQAFARHLLLTLGCLPRLLDERVQHDDVLADREAAERAANARPTAQPESEQAVTEGSRMRQVKAWPIPAQEFDKACMVGENVDRVTIRPLQGRVRGSARPRTPCAHVGKSADTPNWPWRLTPTFEGWSLVAVRRTVAE